MTLTYRFLNYYFTPIRKSSSRRNVDASNIYELFTNLEKQRERERVRGRDRKSRERKKLERERARRRKRKGKESIKIGNFGQVGLCNAIDLARRTSGIPAFPTLVLTHSTSWRAIDVLGDFSESVVSGDPQKISSIFRRPRGKKGKNAVAGRARGCPGWEGESYEGARGRRNRVGGVGKQ